MTHHLKDGEVYLTKELDNVQRWRSFTCVFSQSLMLVCPRLMDFLFFIPQRVMQHGRDTFH